MKPKEKGPTPFEAFVQKIAAVPKEEADKIEADRPKIKRRKRKRATAKGV